MKCARCGEDITGRYCSNCGAAAPAPQFGPEIVDDRTNRWYTRTWVIIISLIIFFPLGLYFMWRGNWGRRLKIAITALVALGIVWNLLNWSAIPHSTGWIEYEPTHVSAPIKEETIPYREELIGGHYVSGIDFPPGVYNIKALRGGGNVISSNAYDGGINAIMGVPEKNRQNDIYQEKYANIRLGKGVTLSISGVTVEISSLDASSFPLARRSQPNLTAVSLGNGHFIAGKDFPTGIYDIIATSGRGNVISSNIMSGGINAMMGSSNDVGSSDMYEERYNNISLDDGVTLTIDGLSVQLVPSD